MRFCLNFRNPHRAPIWIKFSVGDVRAEVESNREFTSESEQWKAVLVLWAWVELHWRVHRYKPYHVSRHGVHRLLSCYSTMNHSLMFNEVLVSWLLDGLGGLVVSMLASGTQVCGFKPGRSRWIFSDVKNPQHAFLRKGSKRICTMFQPCGMSKNLVIYVNYGLLAKFQV